MESSIFKYSHRAFLNKLSGRFRVPLALFVGPLVSLLSSLCAIYFIGSDLKVML